MKIIVVRHGLTEGNTKGISNGQSHDDNLTEEGRQQADDLAERLKTREIDQIFSSPLKRAMETALPIAESIKKSIDVDRRLIEVSFGKFEGRPYTEMEKELGHDARWFLNDYKYDFTQFGGETSEQVEKRVKSFIQDLKKKPYKVVLVVTHGGIVRWLKYITTGEKMGPSQNAVEVDLII